MIDRLLCRILGHSWRPVFGVGGPWFYCHRCGDVSETVPLIEDDPAPAPRCCPGGTRGEK